MSPANAAIVKSLVRVAWADGDYGGPEREMVDALLVAFDASEEQSKELRSYAETKRSLEDIPLEDLSSDDLRVLVQHAVLLTFIDGDQNDKEKEFVVGMAKYLGIEEAESSALIAQAELRARRNLQLL